MCFPTFPQAPKHPINTELVKTFAALNAKPKVVMLFTVMAHLQLQIDLIDALNEKKPAAAWKEGKTYSPN